MSAPRGPNAHIEMDRGYYREPFNNGLYSAKAVVQEIPSGFQSEKRLDYDVRTDDNPVYVAFGLYQKSATGDITPGTADDQVWIVQKFTYDASNRVTRIQVARGAWDNRASLF